MWRELEARLGFGPLLDDSYLPFTYRLDWLRRKLGEPDAEIEALAAWIATDTIDEVWHRMMTLLFELGDHPLWRDEVMHEALLESYGHMTHADQDRLCVAFMEARARRSDAAFVEVVSEGFEALYARDAQHVSVGWMLCLANQDGGSSVDEDALRERLSAASSHELMTAWLGERFDGRILLWALHTMVHQEGVFEHEVALRVHAMERLSGVFQADVLHLEARALRDSIAATLLSDAPEELDRSEGASVWRDALNAYIAQIDREGVTKSAVDALHHIASGSPVRVRHNIERRLSLWVEDMNGSSVGALTHVDTAQFDGGLSLSDSDPAVSGDRGDSELYVE